MSRKVLYKHLISLLHSQVYGRLQGWLGSAVKSVPVCTRWVLLNNRPLKRCACASHPLLPVLVSIALYNACPLQFPTCAALVLNPLFSPSAPLFHRGGKHNVEVLLADMDQVDALQLMVVRGGTGAGNASELDGEEAPRHAAGRRAGLGSWMADRVKAGAAMAVSAAAIQPNAWGLQHAEVLQQDTGETTYFAAGPCLCEAERVNLS